MGGQHGLRSRKKSSPTCPLSEAHLCLMSFGSPTSFTARAFDAWSITRLNRTKRRVRQAGRRIPRCQESEAKRARRGEDRSRKPLLNTLGILGITPGIVPDEYVVSSAILVVVAALIHVN